MNAAVDFLFAVGTEVERLLAPMLLNSEALVVLEKNIAVEVVTRIAYSHKEYGNIEVPYNPSIVKVASMLCFWIKKLKPYSFDSMTFEKYSYHFKGRRIVNSINELCAFWAATSLIEKVDEEAALMTVARGGFTPQSVRSLCSNLRYESMSIPAIISMFQLSYGIY